MLASKKSNRAKPPTNRALEVNIPSGRVALGSQKPQHHVAVCIVCIVRVLLLECYGVKLVLTGSRGQSFPPSAAPRTPFRPPPKLPLRVPQA